jgi:hypothetical protein
MPAVFKASGSSMSPGGVLVVNYERDGNVRTGSFEGECRTGCERPTTGG